MWEAASDPSGHSRSSITVMEISKIIREKIEDYGSIGSLFLNNIILVPFYNIRPTVTAV
jgi:hypothetical protein